MKTQRGHNVFALLIDRQIICAGCDMFVKNSEYTCNSAFLNICLDVDAVVSVSISKNLMAGFAQSPY